MTPQEKLAELIREALEADWYRPGVTNLGLWSSIAHTLAERLVEHVVLRANVEQLGLLIDGTEFVPQAIVEKHMPFATPPGTLVDAVFRIVEDEQ